MITRDTEQEAWAVAGALLDRLDQAEIETAQQILGATESAGQDRMRALHASYRNNGRTSDLEIYPHLWAGVGLVRGGAGTALVGSHTQVANLIEEYARAAADRRDRGGPAQLRGGRDREQPDLKRGRGDTARVAALVGVTRVQRADARSVRERTGEAIGGVAPVGHSAPIRTLVEPRLESCDVVWAAAGHPHTVFPTSYA